MQRFFFFFLVDGDCYDCEVPVAVRAIDPSG
jgi:hypothetical protein